MSYIFLPDPQKSLADYDPDYHGELDKAEGKAKLAELGAELDDMQDYLYASKQHSVLVVLQGMDTAGKDGTIRDVFGYFNALGCNVQAFKAPSEEERDHDFLWRVHKVVPPKGIVSIFNRSHYEDVLAVRVRKLAPKSVWRKRFEHINGFEKLLTDSGTLVLKFFLHISKHEQYERLKARTEDMEKAWKVAASDWEDRKLWDEYQEAYWDVLCKCNSKEAPWYIVPANRKWYRNLAVASVLVEHFKPHVEAWKISLQDRGREGLATIAKLDTEE